MRGFTFGEWGLGVFVLSGCALLAISTLASVGPEIVVASGAMQTKPSKLLRPYAAESLARVAVRRDLFRIDRRPAEAAYDPLRGTSPIPAGPPKPQLTLTGVLWGQQPEAVIEGLPTTDGPRVVQSGDRVGGLLVRRIGYGAVTIVGMDTVWTLTVKEPWK